MASERLTRLLQECLGQGLQVWTYEKDEYLKLTWCMVTDGNHFSSIQEGGIWGLKVFREYPGTPNAGSGFLYKEDTVTRSYNAEGGIVYGGSCPTVTDVKSAMTAPCPPWIRLVEPLRAYKSVDDYIKKHAPLRFYQITKIDPWQPGK